MSSLNDVIKNGIHFPIVYGVAIDLREGTIIPASFPRKEPDIDIRSAMLHRGNHPAVIKLEFIQNNFSYLLNNSFLFELTEYLLHGDK